MEFAMIITNINPCFFKQTKNIFYIHSETECIYQSSIEVIKHIGFYFFSYNKIANDNFEDYESHLSFKLPFKFPDIFVNDNNGSSGVKVKCDITLYDELEDV